MKIVPAIDLIGGKCVRLVQGDYGKMKVYSEDPVDVAEEFEAEGFEYLHLVDLDGARKGKVVNWKVIERIAEKTALKVDFGGGVKTAEEIDRLMGLGVEYINIGSLAVQDPVMFRQWLHDFGADNFILSVDVQDELVKIYGWQKPTDISIFNLVRDFEKDHVTYITCTDIGSDGMMKGPNIGLYKKLKLSFPNHRITASGGISSLDDLLELQYLDVYAVIIGKALYEKKITAQELQNKNLI